MDRFTAMEVFVCVADEGGFTAAARRLGLSKSFVSKQVVALERHLGVRLLNRTTRRLSLTEPGTRFYERGQRILEDLHDAESWVGDLNARPRGVLRINVPVSFGTRHLAPALPEFLARYPELQVDVTLNDRFVDLVNEGYDAAVRITRLDDSSLIARQLARCGSWLCGAPAYLEAHGRPRTAGEVSRHNCLVYAYARQSGEWRIADPEGVEHRLAVRGNLTANNGELLLAAAMQGTGLVLVPDFIGHDAVAAGHLERLLPDHTTPELSISVVYPYTRHVSAKLRVFIDFLVERFGTVRYPWSLPV